MTTTDKTVKHTAGPWRVQRVNRHTFRVLGLWHGDESDLANTTSAYNSLPGETYEQENEANAHLMAAAPELLEACEAAESILRAYIPAELFDGHAAGALAKVREAIAKAKN